MELAISDSRVGTALVHPAYVDWVRHGHSSVTDGGNEVIAQATGIKQIQHPLVGDMTLAFEMLEVPADPGLSVLTYSAEPGTPSEGAMHELARWTETRTRVSAARAGSES